jgi:hypothetical protein
MLQYGCHFTKINQITIGLEITIGLGLQFLNIGPHILESYPYFVSIFNLFIF